MELLNSFQIMDINSGVKKYRSHQKAVLLDVREPYEYIGGHIDTSVTCLYKKLAI